VKSIVHDHILKMAGALSDGVIEQFPVRGTGTITAAANGFSMEARCEIVDSQTRSAWAYHFLRFRKDERTACDFPYCFCFRSSMGSC